MFLDTEALDNEQQLFDHGVRRLSQALSQLGCPAVLPTVLRSGLTEIFDEKDFQVAQTYEPLWLEQTWYQVKYTFSGTDIAMESEPLVALKSKADALALLLQALRQSNVSLTDVYEGGSGELVFIRDSEVIATISRADFEVEPSAGYYGMVHILNELPLFENTGLMEERFRNHLRLPNFRVSDTLSAKKTNVVTPCFRSVANWRYALHDFLARVIGLPVDTKMARYLTARFFGFYDWESMAIETRTHACRLWPYIVNEVDSRNPAKSVTSWYRTLPGALYGFHETIKELEKEGRVTTRASRDYQDRLSLDAVLHKENNERMVYMESAPAYESEKRHLEEARAILEHPQLAVVRLKQHLGIARGIYYMK